MKLISHQLRENYRQAKQAVNTFNDSLFLPKDNNGSVVFSLRVGSEQIKNQLLFTNRNCFGHAEGVMG